MYYIYIIVIIIIAFVLLYLTMRKQYIDKKFYDVTEICPELNNIYNYPKIFNEVENVQKEIWSEWPEKQLYVSKDKKWNIFPFKAFGVIVKDNCNKCPTLAKFINSIPNIKIALLSKLGPGMKLLPHQGWGNHSNNVIRCHFGLDVPNGCYISVSDNNNLSDQEIKYHKNNEWLCFDDSKIHYAHNPTNKDRIVLIVDVVRPKNIKRGNSTIGDTKELAEIINYYKNKNK